MADDTGPADPRCGAQCACVAAATVADLQGPVAELRGYLEALARVDGHTDGRLLAAARATSDRVRDVVDALAAYQQVDRAPRRQQVDLTELTDAAVALLADELAERQIAVDVGRLPVVAVDPQQLYRALTVLVRRVATRSPAGTRLAVGALHRNGEWQLRIGPRTAATGGLPRRVPASPDPADDRPGVELVTAQRAVEAHGGAVWFTGGGTVAWLAIPDNDTIVVDSGRDGHGGPDAGGGHRRQP